MKSLYPGHKVSSREAVFDFLATYYINIQKKLAKFREEKKVVNVTIERLQKWIVSQSFSILDFDRMNIHFHFKLLSWIFITLSIVHFI